MAAETWWTDPFLTLIPPSATLCLDDCIRTGQEKHPPHWYETFRQILTPLVHIIPIKERFQKIIFTYKTPIRRMRLFYNTNNFITFFFQPFVEVPMLFIKAQQRPFLFVGINSMKLIFALSLNIYFVVVLRNHFLKY